MRRRVAVTLALPFLMMSVTTIWAQAPHAVPSSRIHWLDPYREPAARLIGEALGSTFAWDRLSVLTDTNRQPSQRYARAGSGDSMGDR